MASEKEVNADNDSNMMIIIPNEVSNEQFMNYLNRFIINNGLSMPLPPTAMHDSRFQISNINDNSHQTLTNASYPLPSIELLSMENDTNNSNRVLTNESNSLPPIVEIPSNTNNSEHQFNNIINKPKTKFMIRSKKKKSIIRKYHQSQNRYIKLIVKSYGNNKYFYGSVNLKMKRRFRSQSKPTTKPISLTQPYDTRIIHRPWFNAYGGDDEHVLLINGQIINGQIINGENKDMIIYSRSKPHWMCRKKCGVKEYIKNKHFVYIKYIPHPLCIEYCSGCDTYRPNTENIDNNLKDYLQLSAWKELNIFHEYCKYYKIRL